MNIFNQIKVKICQKQADSIINLQRDTIDYALQTSNFLDKLGNQILTHAKTSLTYHSNNIRDYLTSDSHIEIISKPKKEQSSKNQGNATPGIKNSENQGNHIEKRSIIISEKIMPKQVIKNQKIKIDQNIEALDNATQEKQLKEGIKVIKNGQSGLLFNNSKIVSLNSLQKKDKQLVSIDNQSRGKSDQKRYDNPVSADEDLLINKIKPPYSNSIVKRETIKEIQEKKINKKSTQSKSKKLRGRLIKLSPIALQKQKQERQKQASEKIKAAIEFLNNIQTRKKTASYKISEWKQSKSSVEPLNKILSSPINYNFKKQYINSSNKYEMSISLDSQYQKKAYHLISNRKKAKAIKQNEKQFVLEKPPPYNLQHINLEKNEQFLLKFS